MASTAIAFSKSSEGIQAEHQELMERLSELDHALDCLVCYSEVYADLAGLQSAREITRLLAGGLPKHFLREERGIFAEISRRGPGLAAFVREMQRQHEEISKRLESIRHVADGFTETEDLEQSISDLKQQGHALASFVAAHMGAEERKYASLK